MGYKKLQSNFYKAATSIKKPTSVISGQFNQSPEIIISNYAANETLNNWAPAAKLWSSMRVFLLSLFPGGGGVLPRILDRGVPQRFLNPDPI